MQDQALDTKAPIPRSRGRQQGLDRGWWLASIELFIVVATFLLLWPTTLSLGHRWEPIASTTYGHGYLIMAIVVWLLIRNRDRLQDVAPRPNVMAAVLILPVALIWLVMVRANIQSAHQVLLPILLWLAIAAALGLQVAWRSSFPIAYLYFALPVWDVANGLLQSATVMAAEVLLRLSGAHVFVDGNVVHMAAGAFEVAGGCSGLHFFIVALALAALYGEISNDALKVRLKLLALAGALAILTNWIRVYTIILAGYLTDMQHYLVRVEHYRYGWVLFAIAMAAFFIVARRMPVSDLQFVPRGMTDSDRDRPGAVAKGLLLAIVALSVGPLWHWTAPLMAASAPDQTMLLPRSPGSWSGPVRVEDKSWKPVFVGAQLYGSGDYIRSTRRVTAYTAVYVAQEQGKELVGYANSIAGEGAHVVAESRVQSRLPTSEVIAESAVGSSVIRYFYLINSAATNRGVVAELSYGLQSLVTPPVARIFAARASCMPDCVSARAALDDFMNAIDASQLASSASGTSAHE